MDKKYRYTIEIKKPSKRKLKNEWCRDEKYTVWFSKNYGNSYGGVTGYETKPDVIKSLRQTIKLWEEYDSILGKMPDKVTTKNLFFESFTPEITITNILCIQTLGDWM